jgi:ABC-type Fe3+-siderophore transport system permease subunit
MRRWLLLVLAAVCVFVVVAAIMIKLMPTPLKDSDFLLIGSVSTLLALLALFFALISTSLKSPDVFFKRRKKPR